MFRCRKRIFQSLVQVLAQSLCACSHLLLYLGVTGCSLVLLDSCSHRDFKVVERVTHDTICQKQIQYDSVRIEHNTTLLPLPDSLHLDSTLLPTGKVGRGFLLRDHKTEYRYRLLHDTTYIHLTDTIPEVTVIKDRDECEPFLPRGKLILLLIISAISIFIIYNRIR